MQNNNIKYSISILTYKGLETLKHCLSYIFETCTEEYELIITDNASNDGTKEYLKELAGNKKNIIPVLNDKNIGFIEGHNNALGLAGGEYFVVMNNDIFIFEKNWLTKLRQPFENDKKTAITGLAGNPSKMDEDGTAKWDNFIYDYIEASCLMMPTDLARKYGLFSTDFKFAFFEDADLSLRYRQLGYKIVPVKMNFDHLTMNDTKKLDKSFFDGIIARNKRVFKAKWGRYLKYKTFSKNPLIMLKSRIKRYIERQLARSQRELFAEQRKHLIERTSNEKTALDKARKNKREIFEQNDPLISIIVCAYNTPDETLKKTLTSIRAQSWKNYEVLLVSEHSSNYFEETALKLIDNKVKHINMRPAPAYPVSQGYYKNMVQGAFAFNRGLEEAKGSWIIPLKPGIEMDKDHLKKMVEAATSLKKELIFCGARVDDREIGGISVEVKNIFPYAAMFINYLKLFKFDARSYVKEESMEWNLMDRIKKAGVDLACLDAAPVSTSATLLNEGLNRDYKLL